MCEITDKSTDFYKQEIRYDFLHVLYVGMLLNLSPDEIRAFWSKNPLPGYVDKDECAMFTELWQGRNWYSQDYVFSVLNNVEPFLVELKKNCFDFISKSFYLINKGLLMPPRDWLSWSKPLFSSFFSETDIRYLTLKLLNNHTNNLSKTYQMNIVAHNSHSGWNTTVLLMSSAHINDDNLSPFDVQCDLPEFDCELWTVFRIKGIPASTNAPVFENYFMVADHRKIESIITNAVLRGNTLFLDDTAIAIQMSFTDFCDLQKLDLSKYKLPDVIVWVMKTDITCPIRNRVILHKGCAYGAPGYLFGYKYAALTVRPANFLDSIIDDISHFNDNLWGEIKALHNQFIADLTFKAVFVFDRKHEVMQLNGQNLIKNVPAKILRKMLTIYMESGRTEYTHSEFVKDDSIIENPYSPNFVLRLQRLTQALELNNKEVTIRKIERGKFILFASCKIEYSECN